MAALLTQKNFDLRESSSYIDFSELYSVKPKRCVRLIKPKQVGVNPACNYQLDVEVMVYLRRNHAASDMQLSKKKLEKLHSLPCKLNSVETQEHGKLNDNVNDQQTNASITHTNMQHIASDMIVSKVSDIRDQLFLFFEEEAAKKSKYDILSNADSEISNIFVATNQDISQLKSEDNKEKDEKRVDNKDVHKSSILHKIYKRVVRFLRLI